jgi:hypothetical protein
LGVFLFKFLERDNVGRFFAALRMTVGGLRMTVWALKMTVWGIQNDVMGGLGAFFNSPRNCIRA